MGDYADDAMERDFYLEMEREENPEDHDLDDHDYSIVAGNRQRNRTMKVTEFSYLEFECVLKQSEKAWLIRFPNNAGQAWFPKSNCKVNMRECILTIPEWLFMKKVEEFALKKVKVF